jgi:hypothetical protein
MCVGDRELMVNILSVFSSSDADRYDSTLANVYSGNQNCGILELTIPPSSSSSVRQLQTMSLKQPLRLIRHDKNIIINIAIVRDDDVL